MNESCQTHGILHPHLHLRDHRCDDALKVTNLHGTPLSKLPHRSQSRTRCRCCITEWHCTLWMRMSLVTNECVNTPTTLCREHTAAAASRTHCRGSISKGHCTPCTWMGHVAYDASICMQCVFQWDTCIWDAFRCDTPNILRIGTTPCVHITYGWVVWHMDESCGISMRIHSPIASSRKRAAAAASYVCIPCECISHDCEHAAAAASYGCIRYECIPHECIPYERISYECPPYTCIPYESECMAAATSYECIWYESTSDECVTYECTPYKCTLYERSHMNSHVLLPLHHTKAHHTTWINRVAYQCVMSRTNETRRIWMYKLPFWLHKGTSHYMDKSCRVSMSHVTDKRNMSQMDAYTPFLNAQNTLWHMVWLQLVGSLKLWVSRRGKFTTNLSPNRRIRHVKNTTSCHNFDTKNLHINWISIAPGGVVPKKICNTNTKGLGTYSNLLRNARWNLHFSPTVCKRAL